MMTYDNFLDKQIELINLGLDIIRKYLKANNNEIKLKGTGLPANDGLKKVTITSIKLCEFDNIEVAGYWEKHTFGANTREQVPIKFGLRYNIVEEIEFIGLLINVLEHSYYIEKPKE